MAKPEGGRFDEATYERARKFREQAGKTAAPTKTPSKTRVSNPVPKKAMEQAKDMRHMQDTISASERNAERKSTDQARDMRHMQDTISASERNAAKMASQNRPALAITPGVMKKRDALEAKRAAVKAEGASKRAAEKEASAAMSPAERSAARGKKIKSFFGLASGGKAYAKGGKIDGCAMKGKTKAKMY